MEEEYLEEFFEEESDYIHIKDFCHAQDMLESIVRVIYKTGDIEQLEDSLEELLAVYDMKIPQESPIIKRNQMTNSPQINDVYSEEDIKVIKNLIDPSGKLSDDQINLFLHVCKEKKLDPRTKQIYAVPRWNSKSGKAELTIQTSIDGFRLIAERTGKYAPGKPTEFHYNEKHALTGATVFVKKYTVDGTWHEVSATAFLHEYKPNGNNTFWNKMPSVMIEKVAESKALRRAFPGDFSGIYTDDEMAQAKVSVEAVKEVEQVKAKPTLLITDKQARELDDLIGSDVKYRQSVLKFIKAANGLDSFCGMPLETYNRAMIVAKQRYEKRNSVDARAMIVAKQRYEKRNSVDAIEAVGV